MAASEIVFWSALAFLFGVLAAGVLWPFLFFGALALLCIGFLIGFSKQFRHWSAVLIVTLFAFGGFFYAHVYANVRAERTHIAFTEKTAYKGVIVSEPTVTETVQKFTLRLDRPFYGDVEVITDRVPLYSYGDALAVTGTVKDPSAPVVVFPDIEKIGEHQASKVQEVLIGFKQRIVTSFRATLPSDASALLAGLTFGIRGDFTKDFKAEMAASGTTHLVALSGYNISILVVAVSGALKKFVSRRLRFYLTALAIVLFVLMVGGEASVVRAAIMGFLALLAKESGRLFSVRNAIGVTAACMALVDPTILVSNIGFQLSFASLIGMVYLGKPVARILHVDVTSESIFNWRDNLVTTIAAQLAVIPFLLHYFGAFSLTSIVANVLLLAFVPGTMLLGFLLGALSLLSGTLAALISWVVNIPLQYELGIIHLFARLRIPLPVFGSSFLWIVVYYGVVLMLILRFSSAQPRPEGAAERNLILPSYEEGMRGSRKK